MKLRQKLAAVMAAAMVVTAVPVVTMAGSKNSVSNTVAIVEDSTMGFKVETDSAATTQSVYTVNNSSEAEYKYRYIPTLELQPTSNYNLSNAPETFFISIENANLSDEAYLAFAEGTTINVAKSTGKIVGGKHDGKEAKDVLGTIEVKLDGTVATPGSGELEITKISSTELKVTVKADITKDTTIKVPLFATAKKGEVAVTIDGTDCFATSERIVIGSTTEANKQFTAAIENVAKLTVDGGTIGNIVITEQVLNAFKEAKGEDRNIEIELPTNSDLEFLVNGKDEMTVEIVGGRGFAAVAPQTVQATLKTDSRGNVDTQTLVVTVPEAFQDPTARGTISIQGIKVVPEGKAARTGDVEVTVRNNNMASTKLTVAAIHDHLVDLTCEKPAEIVSGKEAKVVEFKLDEKVKDTIVKSRRAEFTLTNGFIAVRDYNTTTEKYETAMDTFKRLIDDEKIVLPKAIKADDIVAVEANAEGQITGFTVQFDNIDTTKANELTFKMPVMTELNTTGEVKLAVEGRAIAEKLEVVVANAKAPVEVKAEPVTLKVGLNGQVGGKLTITETDKEMLERGTLTITMPSNSGITFVKDQDLQVKATGLRVKDVKVSADAITFAVDRTSEEAGSIEIENIEFNVNRMAPEGKFDLAIAGPALSSNVYMKEGVDNMVVEDFVVIGTANTEDMAQNGLKKGTASFAIGSNKYTVNGEEKQMDGAAFLSNGRTMVPVRYVSEAFGIDGNNVLFNDGTVTLFAGSRIVQLKNGSNIATVNGAEIPMDEKVTIKEGRTYIPMGEIGRILGVKVTWDNEAKTATFTN